MNSFDTSSHCDKAKVQLIERTSERRASRFSQGEQYEREADLKKLNHELTIHQMELELQNAALQEALQKAETTISLSISDRKIVEAKIQEQKQFFEQGKEVEMKLDLPGISAIVIESDENKLRQVLINFVGNALKFTENGYIEIGAQTIGELVQFHVKDTGIGIPVEFQVQIFERFHQVEPTDTRKYGGNGLGLKISKALVELLGGEVWLESGEGIGSTFYFTIPLRA